MAELVDLERRKAVISVLKDWLVGGDHLILKWEPFADEILAALRANTVHPEGVERASVIEKCAAYLDGYAGGHYMAKSCATALRALSTSDDTSAAVYQGNLLDVDEARLQLWKAIEAVTIGNKWDDKLILENLRKQGFWIAAFSTSGSTPEAVADV